MYSYMICFGLKELPIWVLWAKVSDMWVLESSGAVGWKPSGVDDCLSGGKHWG